MSDEPDVEAQRPLDEVPPWHPYCGCHGCRAGDKFNRRQDQGASGSSATMGE